MVNEMRNLVTGTPATEVMQAPGQVVNLGIVASTSAE